jgi:phosphate acetyltransferase
MEPLAKLQNRARAHPQEIVLADGEDDRVILAAARAVSQSLAKPTLLGRPAIIRSAVDRLALRLDGIELIDPLLSRQLDAYAGVLFDSRRSTGITIQEAHDIARKPVYFAALRVAAGDAQAAILGLANTIAEAVQAARDCIALAPTSRILSSFSFLQVYPRNGLVLGHNNALLFADWHVVSEPSAQQLADIALATAENARELLETEPRVALLSSSKVSAPNSSANRIRETMQIAKARAPKLKIENLQADVALNPLAAGPNSVSSVAGRANVLIFPDADSGHVSCGLLEAVGGAVCFGPILQGLQEPVGCLSHISSVDQIIGTVAIAAVQAISRKELSAGS